MIIFDTDVVTLIAYGTNEPLRKRVESASEGEELAIAIITRMEVLQGRFASILKAADGAELAAATQRFRASEEMLNEFVLLYPDDASGERFEFLLKQKKRRKMRRPDMLIASIALAHNALLVTRNTGDYQGVNGLQVENWAD